MGKSILDSGNSGSSLRLSHVWLRHHYPHFMVKRLRIIEVIHLVKTLQVENGRLHSHLKTASEYLHVGLITSSEDCCVREEEM